MKKILFLFSFSVLMAFSGWAQKTITGVVNDASGLPLPGAAVVIDGTAEGVATDFDGNYSIEANEGDVLVFSFVGFVPQKITVGASDVINVSIQEDSSELQEVVVTAYGTQKRESIAGAVSIISADQIENATFSNAAKSLEGLVSGLRVIQSSGQPGSDPIIRIRGFGSINADNSPLIVLDGVPYSGSLNSINPQDIESTSVLKDANSTSLYGNKASNGALLITTKKIENINNQFHLENLPVNFLKLIENINIYFLKQNFKNQSKINIGKFVCEFYDAKYFKSKLNGKFYIKKR